MKGRDRHPDIFHEYSNDFPYESIPIIFPHSGEMAIYPKPLWGKFPAILYLLDLETFTARSSTLRPR